MVLHNERPAEVSHMRHQKYSEVRIKFQSNQEYIFSCGKSEQKFITKSLAKPVRVYAILLSFLSI